MIRLLFLSLLLFLVVSSKNIDLIKKGENIAKKLCDINKLQKIDISNEEKFKKEILDKKVCLFLKKGYAKALIAYLKDKNALNISHIEVPKDSKCPVCGMFVYKYPKWAAHMRVDGKDYYFDGVKDMMKFFIFDGDFPYDRKKIEKMEVSDFYTLDAIDAKKAFYVIGSNVYGPMGNELIPFKNKKEALNFIKDHGGKIVKFSDIDDKLVISLDRGN
ncbi:MAG: hypothetical protein GXO02_04970 [Epsilonproteobacteria bacterium]|nr:hypothetical protein [Campylobacterota bacterium]